MSDKQQEIQERAIRIIQGLMRANPPHEEWNDIICSVCKETLSRRMGWDHEDNCIYKDAKRLLSEIGIEYKEWFE
jgi:hypothetical protein